MNSEKRGKANVTGLAIRLAENCINSCAEIRDSAECTMVPRDVVPEIVASRGYEDIDPERAWDGWNAIRPSLGL